MGISLDGRRDIAQRRATRAATLILVALLHVIAYWAIPSTVRLPVDRKQTAFEWVFIAPTHEAESIRVNAPELTERSPVTARVPKSLSAQPTISDDSSRPPDKPSIDWNSELELVAKSAVPDDGSGSASVPNAHPDFGYPRRPTPTKPPPAFAWGRKRVERMSGAVIVHISDNCVLVFTPLPIIGCGIGKKPANGHLLDHMQEDTAMAEAPAP